MYSCSAKAAQARLAKKEAEAAKEALIASDGPQRSAVLETAVITGNLASRPDSLDLKIDSFSVTTYGKELVRDTTLELNYGRRYGLIGQNGSGKSTILAAVGAREIPIPDMIDTWLLDHEAPPSDLTAVEAVIEHAKNEHERLENNMLKLIEEDAEKHADMIAQIGDKLDRMDPQTFETKAFELLNGLGFLDAMLKKATKDMSGGWRMRVSLAQALFVQPTLLLLDEPTNHLDLGACVWLENLRTQLTIESNSLLQQNLIGYLIANLKRNLRGEK